MKVSAATLGFAGAATVAVTSTVLLNSHLSQNVDDGSKKDPNPEHNPSALRQTLGDLGQGVGDVSGTEQSGVAFKALFDAKKINRNARPILNFDKGSCFSSFFPEADLSAPNQTTGLKSNVSSEGIIPSNFSLSGNTQPAGCKMMKFSGAKDDAAFGYMTETTVRNNKYGLAMYAVATNTRQRTMTDLEYWLLFMENKDNKWTVNKSYYFALSMGATVINNGQSVQKQNNFYAQAPDKTEMKWSSPTTDSETFGKFFDTSSDKSSLWDDAKDKHYVGLWTGGNGGSNEDLFYDGSNEKWALKEWFSANEVDKQQGADKFLQQVKLTQKGKWQSIGDACADLKGKEVSSMTTSAISKCIQSKALISSTVS